MDEAGQEHARGGGVLATQLGSRALELIMRGEMGQMVAVQGCGITSVPLEVAAGEAEVEKWLKKPSLLKADKGASYAAVIEIDLSEIAEPILACPNDPDDVKLLSEVAGDASQDVFIGSCMVNIGHFRASGEIWREGKFNPNVRTWICPPTRMDQQQLKDEAYFSVYSAVGARVEIDLVARRPA